MHIKIWHIHGINPGFFNCLFVVFDIKLKSELINICDVSVRVLEAMYGSSLCQAAFHVKPLRCPNTAISAPPLMRTNGLWSSEAVVVKHDEQLGLDSDLPGGAGQTTKFRLI